MEEPAAARHPPFRLERGKWGTGRGGGQWGYFWACQGEEGEERWAGGHVTDCWVEFVPDGGKPVTLAFDVTPDRNGRTDLRVQMNGKKLTFTRVLARAFLSRRGVRCTWSMLRKRYVDGQPALQIDHDDHDPFNCRLRNLIVRTGRENAQKEAARAAAGRRRRFPKAWFFQP